MADTWYVIIDGSGNAISTGTVIADDAELAEQGYTAVELAGDPAGKVWNTTTRTFDAAPVTPNSYSTLVFIQRFTAAEFWAFRNSTDPGIQFFMYQLEHATVVVPQDPTIQGALAYAVSLDLLTSERAAVIGAN